MTKSTKSNTFHTRDLFSIFTSQGHNPRTRNAFEYGVKCAVLDLTPLYDTSKSDYAAAERAGFTAAKNLLDKGKRWICDECGHRHGQLSKTG